MILKAPDPGAEPVTVASISASEGRPYLLNLPQVESGPEVILDELGGVNSSFGRSDSVGDLASKKFETTFLGSSDGSVMAFGDQSGRSLIRVIKTAETPVTKSSETRLGPCHQRVRVPSFMSCLR